MRYQLCWTIPLLHPCSWTRLAECGTLRSLLRSSADAFLLTTAAWQHEQCKRTQCAWRIYLPMPCTIQARLPRCTSPAQPSPHIGTTMRAFRCSHICDERLTPPLRHFFL